MRSARPYILFALAVFVYVLLRAILVPVIHDEARTFQLYVLTGDWLPFQASMMLITRSLGLTRL